MEEIYPLYHSQVVFFPNSFVLHSSLVFCDTHRMQMMPLAHVQQVQIHKHACAVKKRLTWMSADNVLVWHLITKRIACGWKCDNIQRKSPCGCLGIALDDRQAADY